MQQIDQKDTVTAERSRHLRTGWQDRLLAGIVLEPLLYLCLGLCLSWLSARLYRRTFFSYALLLAFSCAARALAELCAALIVWQQAPSASVLLLGTLLRFALCFFGGAAEYPILRLFAKSGEPFAGRGENAALESKD